MNSPSTLRAIYAFSGDPITFGHIDIVKRAARTYPHVLVAIGINPSKANRYTFDDEERLAMAELCFEDLPNVECKIFQGLLGEYAYRHGYDVIIRGIRNNSDLESELVLYKVNETLHPELDTVFFPTKPELSHISSSVVKALIRESGDVSKYCHLGVKEALERRLLKKSLIGLSGGIACGKTYLAKKLINLLNEEIQATYISLDEIGHYVLSDHSHRLYRRTRDLIVKTFGDEVANLDGTINRKALGAIVSGHQSLDSSLLFSFDQYHIIIN